MKVEPGIYPLNGADENSVCLTTVDFALTYFLVSGELERSGVPVNLIINDAGGLSVLTSWAAGKFSSSSIAKFFQEQDIEVIGSCFPAVTMSRFLLPHRNYEKVYQPKLRY